jgi:hypothetical protein
MTRRSPTARSRRATCCSLQSRSSPTPSSSIGASSPISLQPSLQPSLHTSLHTSLHRLRHRSRHRSLHPFTRCKLTDLGIPELQRRLSLSGLSGSTLRYLAPEVTLTLTLTLTLALTLALTPTLTLTLTRHGDAHARPLAHPRDAVLWREIQGGMR